MQCFDQVRAASRMTREAEERLAIGWNLFQAGDLPARPAASSMG